MSRINLGLSLLLMFAAFQAAAVPQIQHWRTANGAEVYYVAAPQLPIVDVRVVFNAGSARDEGKPGLAVLTNAMLAEGAGKLDADALAERFEGLGAQFGNEALRDMAIVSLRSLRRADLLEPALETLALIIGEPTFPAAALERERARVLVGLRQREQSLNALAEKAFFDALYASHPYATPPLGNPESVAALQREELRAFHRRYYVARNATVAIVGDIDRAGAERIAARVIGALPEGEPAPPLPAPQLPSTDRRVEVPFPSSQTHILLGQLGMTRDDPDYFPLYVGNHILGGSGLVSRIAEEVREKRGLAYSAYSYFAPMQVQGPFQLGLQTQKSSTEEALGVLRQTLEGFVAKGPTAQELEAAKRNITGSFPLSIDSNGDIVQYLAVIGFYRLPLDYLQTFTERVEAVTAAQIRDAFQRRVDPDRLLTVTVGAAS